LPVADDEDEDERPVAWNPLTPGGVAAYANAPLSHLLATQGAVAFLLWLTLMFYLSQSWAPAIDDTIERLPAGSRVSDGHLAIPGDRPVYFTDNRLVGIMWARGDAPGSGADIDVRLHPDKVSISSLLGYLALPYPPMVDQPLSRDLLAPRWGAWRPAIIPVVAGALALGVWAGWFALAALYAWPIRVIVFFRDKLTSRLGCWKLCSAALMPGALLLTAALLFYTLGQIPLAGLLIAFGIHFVLGWSYVICGAIALPLLPETAALKQGNPFSNGKSRKRGSSNSNPFSG